MNESTILREGKRGSVRVERVRRRPGERGTHMRMRCGVMVNCFSSLARYSAMSFLAAEGRLVSSWVRVNWRRPASLRLPTSETEPRALRDERRNEVRACSAREGE